MNSLRPLPILPPNSRLPWINLVNTFSYSYPIPKASNKGEFIISLTKMYRHTPQCLDYLEAISLKELVASLNEGVNHFWFIRFLSARRIPFSLPSQTTNTRCIAWNIRTGTSSNEITLNNQSWILLEVLRANPYVREALLTKIGSPTLFASFFPKENATDQDVLNCVNINVPSIQSDILFRLSVQLDHFSDSELSVVVNAYKEYLGSFDVLNPILFRSAVLFAFSLAPLINKAQPAVCEAEDAFLINLASKANVSKAMLYEGFASLRSIMKATGKHEKGCQDLKKVCENKKFKKVNFPGCEPFCIEIQKILE